MPSPSPAKPVQHFTKWSPPATRALLPLLLLLAFTGAIAQSASTLGQDLFAKSQSTAMVLVVVHDQDIFFQGYGETAPGSGQLPTPDSLLRLCSLTKIFTTDLLVKLAVDKKLHLETPLQDLAPNHAAVPSKDGRPITLGDLATHTAGLPREMGPYVRGIAHFTYPNFDQRWAWLPSQHLLTAPGTAAAYSNVGFDLLGDAIQSAGHESYPQLLAERTTHPLAMFETTFSPTPGQCARLLQAGSPQGACADTTATDGSSGLYSTAHDMTQWLKYLLGTATPAVPAQNPAAQASYLLPTSLLSMQGLEHAGTPSGIGLGWVHILTPDNGEIIQKTGGGAGFATYIAFDPAHHIALFLAATEDRPAPRRAHPNPAPPEAPFHLFRQANNLLLSIAGLPVFPPDPIPPPRAPRNRVARHLRTNSTLTRNRRRKKPVSHAAR